MAGKTGSTNLEGKDGTNNSWFSGYTTNYTIGIWTGYDDHQRIIENTKIAQALFKHTMAEISKDIETPDFKKPDSVVEVAVEKGTNPPQLPSDYTPKSNVVKELFVKGHEPTKVSEKFDQLDPVSGLNAVYIEETNAIHVEWTYDEEADVSFEVSASVNGGQMQTLSSAEDRYLEITEVEPGAEYVIQVVAVSNQDEGMRSKPAQATVKITDTEEDEDEGNDNNGGNIQSVEGLTAYYDANKGIIDVSWSYNGPPVSFEVDVKGQKQVVESNGIEISGVTPGEYTITVTPIGKRGANQGVRGEPRSINQSVNDQETNGTPDQNDQNNDSNG